MIRTHIYLTDEEKRGLESMAASRGVSQSDLIRQAIDDLLARTSTIHPPATVPKTFALKPRLQCPPYGKRQKADHDDRLRPVFAVVMERAQSKVRLADAKRVLYFGSLDVPPP